MDWRKILIDGYNRIPESMQSIGGGLTQEDMDWQPRNECNSIGWTLWHLSRQQDAQIASLMNVQQIWIEQQWYLKFKRTADAQDTGFGHSPQTVAEFISPPIQEFLDYQRAVLQRSMGYFNQLTESDLDRELDEPWFNPLPTLGVRLVSILGDSLMHIGQAAYIRGLLQGKGWQSY